ncbi:hypothetical protein TNCV_1589011 [Trichonephila clavipes]|uniref:Uncharacterized protein n=1 Tax=Trichonephila clavipes TaxID=2585209 RepID=A0A8X6RJI8_TRICX|nr:hypothetical protein TNCV_1589011 [Trichonephila clavipes]
MCLSSLQIGCASFPYTTGPSGTVSNSRHAGHEPATLASRLLRPYILAEIAGCANFSTSTLPGEIAGCTARGDWRFLDVLPGRGRKPVGTESVEEVATAVVERASSSIYSSASGRLVSCDLEIPWSTFESPNFSEEYVWKYHLDHGFVENEARPPQSRVPMPESSSSVP